jgi:hypothetical protein
MPQKYIRDYGAEERACLQGGKKNQTGETSIMRGLMVRSRGMEWAGHVASMEKKRKAYRILIVKPEEKRTPLEDLL